MTADDNEGRRRTLDEVHRHIAELRSDRFAARFYQALGHYVAVHGRTPTQSEVGAAVAERLGVESFSQSGVSRWYQGKLPSTEASVALADFFGVRPAWLLLGDGEMTDGQGQQAPPPLQGKVVPPSAFIPAVGRAHRKRSAG